MRHRPHALTRLMLRRMPRRARRAVLALAALPHGGVAIEFAVAFPIFLAMIYAMFEFSRAFYIQASLDYAIEEAARFAMVTPNVSNAAIQNEVTNALSGLTPIAANSVTINAAITGGNAVIDAAYTFNLMVPIAPLSNYMLRANIVMPVVQ